MRRDSAAPAPPPSRTEIFGWCCFDFANSSFTTVIITVVFAVYFSRVIVGEPARADALWGATLALSQLLVVVLGPFLGSVADQTGRKKWFLGWAALGCALPTIALAFTGRGDVALAVSLVVLANFFFSLGENFNASFLPELSTRENCGRISGYGWAFGYFGGLASLALALGILQAWGRPATWTFAATGLFFLVASLPTFLLLRERAPRRPWPPPGQLFVSGWRETFRFLRRLPARPALFRFFLAFFTFMMGVTAVVAFAAIYAERRFGFTQEEIILLFIALQLFAAAGAFAFGYLQDRLGSRPALLASLLGWCGVAVGAWLAQTQLHFWFVAALAGTVMGSTQSASRALVATLTERGAEGETFGYWGLFGKLAAVVGPLTFGQVSALASDRTAILLTGAFFLLGLAIVSTIPEPARKEAES